MHEEPQVPNFGQPGKGPKLEEGMVLAIEPMVNAGGPMVRMGNDGWSVFSEDGSLAAHFEFTVAVTADGPRVLTPWHERSSERADSVSHRSGAYAAAAAGGLPYLEKGGPLLRSTTARGALRADGLRSRALIFAAPAMAAPQPYGTNDAGGFRNVLPPGGERTRHPQPDRSSTAATADAAALRRSAAALRKPRLRRADA